MIAFIGWCLIGLSLVSASFHPAAIVLFAFSASAALMGNR